jgi:hypothetical protein
VFHVKQNGGVNRGNEVGRTKRLYNPCSHSSLDTSKNAIFH